MSDQTPLPPMLAQAELTEQIAKALAQEAGDGWQTLRLHADVLAPVSDFRFEVERDGETESEFTPDEVGDLVDELRRLMYEPGTGTWFSFDLTVSAGGGLDIAYDYESQPLFAPTGVDAETFAADHNRFPRDAAHRPEWLQGKLAEAGGGEPASEAGTTDTQGRIDVAMELWHRMVPADAPLAPRVLADDDVVAVSHTVRGGGTIYIAADGSPLFAGSEASEEQALEALRAGRRTPLEHFRPADAGR